MSCDFDSTQTSLDRTFFNLSSMLAEPLCQASRYLYFRMAAPLDPTKFENHDHIVKEIAFRSLLGVGSVAALVAAPFALIGSAAALGVGHLLLRQAAYFCQTNGYTHIRGNAPEKSFDSGAAPKIFTGNHAGPGGGMSLNHAGTIDWRPRLDAIVREIENEDADVVVLQEYFDGAFAEALMARLNDRYAHCFTQLGQNWIGSKSGVVVLSKAAVHKFSFTTFSNNDWTLTRGFASLEIKRSPDAKEPFCRVIGTHLKHGDALNDQVMRMVQVAEIVESIQKSHARVPTFLAGDLNIERDGEEGERLGAFRHAYTENEPTCTNRLIAQWNNQARGTWGETIDYISVYKDETSENLEFVDCHLVRAFDETYNTKTAWSDHHSLAVTVKGFES